MAPDADRIAELEAKLARIEAQLRVPSTLEEIALRVADASPTFNTAGEELPSETPIYTLTPIEKSWVLWHCEDPHTELKECVRKLRIARYRREVGGGPLPYDLLPDNEKKQRDDENKRAEELEIRNESIRQHNARVNREYRQSLERVR